MLPFVSPRGRRAMLETAVRQLPSTMARLAYIAGLRDPNSGVYTFPCVSSQSEKAETARLLKAMHEEVFSTWLNYCLEEQKADLELYFSGLDCGKATAAETWLRLESYRLFIPASATAPEKQLFIADLEALLGVMARGLGLGGDVIRGDSEGPLLTTKEVSKWLNVPVRTVRLWAEIGEIAGVKVGRQWRFRRDNVRDWLKRMSGMNDI